MSLTKNEIKLIKSLQNKRQREENKLFVIEGEKMVSELLEQKKFQIKCIYFTDDYDTDSIPSTINAEQITSKDLDRITGFKKANKVLAVVHQLQNTVPNYSENNLVLILDDVNDPGNLGTIIRTADWFGITQIIASEKTVELYNPKVIQSSMGAVYRMNYIVSDLALEINNLKENNFNVAAAIINGKNIYNTTLSIKTALVMGSESHGVSDELLKLIDLEISIPNFGKTESLNVAMATGILLSEYKR
jgi:TrmH family RNA methyltransferase